MRLHILGDAVLLGSRERAGCKRRAEAGRRIAMNCYTELLCLASSDGEVNVCVIVERFEKMRELISVPIILYLRWKRPPSYVLLVKHHTRIAIVALR